MRWLLLCNAVLFFTQTVNMLRLVKKDQGRGRGYWYLRAKWKLDRQVAGLSDQLQIAREANENLERLFKTQREVLKRWQNQSGR